MRVASPPGRKEGLGCSPPLLVGGPPANSDDQAVTPQCNESTSPFTWNGRAVGRLGEDNWTTYWLIKAPQLEYEDLIARIAR